MSPSYSFGIGVDTKIINSKYDGEERKVIQATTNTYMFQTLLISGIIGGIVYSTSIILSCL